MQPRLLAYLGDGAVPIDKKMVIESDSALGVGAKNWLFAGSLRSRKRAAAIMGDPVYSD